MSRIGKRPIAIPDGVSVAREGAWVQVKGPKGELAERLPASIDVAIDAGEVRFARSDDRQPTRAAHGLARALVANMVTGVTEGFAKELEIQGVGYRAEMAGSSLKLALGFSHPVEVPVPDGLSVKVQDNRIRVEGIDKQRVGQFAADIRKLRPPEPYKGKGIRYADEQVRRKVGKAGAGA
jgi:large subunit ribosomal protein L6